MKNNTSLLAAMPHADFGDDQRKITVFHRDGLKFSIVTSSAKCKEKACGEDSYKEKRGREDEPGQGLGRSLVHSAQTASSVQSLCTSYTGTNLKYIDVNFPHEITTVLRASAYAASQVNQLNVA